jgi:two-component system sensor histidine kinase KdpD
MQIKQIPGPWKSGDRLLVAVSPSPLSERLIRWTRRTAYNLEGEWLAVHVESPNPLSPTDKERLLHNLQLARELGGEVVSTVGSDVIEALLRVARQRNVTQIVVGKPAHTPFQDLLRGGSLVNRLVRASGEIDVYVVTGDRSESSPQPRVPRPEPHSRWHQYLIAGIIISIVTAINLVALPVIGYQAVGLSELLAVLLIAAYIGRGPAIFAAALTAISWDYLFIPPRFTFTVKQLEDFIVLILYFIIAIFAGNFTARIRSQERQARSYAERTTALYTLARETSTAVNMDDALRTAIAQITQVFHAPVAIFLRTPSGDLSPEPYPESTLVIDSKEFSVADWAFEKGKPAGRFTDTLAAAEAHHMPLLTPSGTVGVLSVGVGEQLSTDEELLLDTFARQIALVIEREMLDEAAEQAAMLEESERLYTTLLNSISHELRTPIATITGAASSLLDPHVNSDARGALAHDIQASAERLNRLVENLLDMSRLESGRLKLKLEWCDVRDLIGVTAAVMKNELAEHPFTIEIAPDLPLVQMDFVLMQQVLVNLLDNAAHHTPPGTPVYIDARQDGQQIRISVRDEGPGIPAADTERIFDKFYRVPGTSVSGTGLGLSISRGLVVAHGGTLDAGNRPEGGTEFIIRLPVGSAPPPAQEAAV